MTATELTEHLRAAHAVLEQRDGSTVVGWELHGQVQLQRIDLVRALGETCARIICPVTARLAPVDALEHNLGLACGGLALLEGAFVLQHLLPLSPLTPAVLGRAMLLTAHEAARLSRCGLPRPAGSSPSDVFAD